MADLNFDNDNAEYDFDYSSDNTPENYDYQESQSDEFNLEEDLDGDTNDDDVFDPSKIPAPQNGDEVVDAIVNGESALDVIVAFGDDVISNLEYDSISVEFDRQFDVLVVTFDGDKEELQLLWNQLEKYQDLLNEHAEDKIDENSIVPVCHFRFLPDKYFGTYSLVLAAPILWAFSGDSYGDPATKVIASFSVDFCNIYETGIDINAINDEVMAEMSDLEDDGAFGLLSPDGDFDAESDDYYIPNEEKYDWSAFNSSEDD